MRTRNFIAGMAVAGLSLAGGHAVMATPITSGLQIHLSADAGVTESGGAVSAWQSQAGNSLTVEQSDEALRPTYISNVAELGGAAAIEFSRTSENVGQFLAANLGAAFDANESTVFFVGRSNSNRSAPYELRTADGTGQYLSRAGSSWTSSDGGMFVAHHSGDGTTSTRLQTLNMAMDTNYHIVATVVNKAAADIEIILDGTNMNIGVNASLSNTVLLDDISRVVVGARNDGATWAFDGLIAELIVYDRILSESEMNEVGYYLQEKYGLAGAYVPEPASLVLMGAGGLMLLRRRR